MRTSIRMGVHSSREGSTEPRIIEPRGSNHYWTRGPVAGGGGGGGNHTATPDEGIHKKNRGCGYQYMTHKWHQMHHEQHPSYILPLDLKIHPKIVK